MNVPAHGAGLRRQFRSGRWHVTWRNDQGLSRYGGRPWQHLRASLRGALAPDWQRGLLVPACERRWRQEILAQAGLDPAFAQRSRAEDRLKRLQSLRSARLLPTPAEAAGALQHAYPVVGAERYVRVAAGHGIIPLSPFSDRRLLELCVHLPDRQRLRDGWTKPALRQAMTERMPEPVRLRTDKQHLAWRLTISLTEQPEAQLPELLPEQRDVLMPYLVPGKLDTLQLGNTGPGRKRLVLFSLTRLAAWLSR